jgi:hypothetical protein
MPRPSYTRGQLSSCSPIPATSLGSLAHLAVGMATGKTQTSLRARLNGSKPRTWFRPPGGRRGRNGYHGMPAVGSKHASPVDYCSRSKTLQAPMFVSVRSIEKRRCRLDAGLLDDRLPLLDFGLLIGAKRLRCLLLSRKDILRDLDEPAPHRWIGEAFDDCIVELGDGRSARNAAVMRRTTVSRGRVAPRPAAPRWLCRGRLQKSRQLWQLVRHNHSACREPARDLRPSM